MTEDDLKHCHQFAKALVRRRYPAHSSDDEYLSAVNLALGKGFSKYNPKKGSLRTFLRVITYRAVIHWIRKQREYDSRFKTNLRFE